MKRITITIPKNGELWQVSFGNSGHPIRRKDATTILQRIEKRLLASQLRDKTVISVKSDGLTINESLPSKNPKYLCWILYAFLEDYVSRKIHLAKEKLYLGNEA